MDKKGMNNLDLMILDVINSNGYVSEAAMRYVMAKNHADIS